MRNLLPKIFSYGQYKSDNYGAHCLAITVNDLTVYFSYQTPVAFRTTAYGLIVRENVWGPTTGKHLNWVDGGNKKNRVSTETFELLWSKYVVNAPITQGVLFDV